jgi:dTDP-4-amino-4,6-dideoxygalactose transaminase
MSAALRHCGIPALTPWQCLRGLSGDHGVRPWPELDGHRTIWTYLGRTAIALACQALGVRPGDEVLAPSYNCGTEVDPLLVCGAKVVLYRVDERTSIDEADVRRRATPRTRLLYVTHYFGWPQELGALRRWCSERGIALLEDGALALFSRAAWGPIGSVGDAAVFSFPKWFAVPDGGALLLRRERGEPEAIALRAPPASTVLRKTLPLLKSHGLRVAERLGAFGVARRLLARRAAATEDEPDASLPDIPPDYYFIPEAKNWGPSSLTRSVLAHADPSRIMATRRRNYDQLSDALRGVAGVTPLHRELPEGVCPLVFPVVVERRADYVRALNARGIAAVPWWAGYHRALEWREFPEARQLKDHLLALPIHQDLDTAHIAYEADQVRHIASART